MSEIYDQEQEDPDECEICEEPFTGTFTGSDERGEFIRDGEHVIAHAQCGLDFELELA